MTVRMMKKSRKKIFLNWKNRFGAVILFNLALCGGLVSAAEETPAGSDSGGGVTVRVRPEDAQRLQDLERLRRELETAKAGLFALETENAKLRESTRKSRDELIELTNKYQEQNEQYRQLRLVLADALASGKVRSVGEREEQLLRTVSDTAESGGELAVRAVQFCELADEIMRELPVGSVRQAELRLKAGELKASSRRFISLTAGEASDSTLEKCRILAVNPELSLVVLSVGSVHGAFHGLVYYVGKEDTVRLRVVGIRPFVAAAAVVSGEIDKLTPGMEAVTEAKNTR